MSQASRWLYATTFILVAAGFLLPFWPLSVAGIASCALSGRWIFSVVMALLVDVAWGAPLGTAQFLYFPLTLFALLCTVARLWGGRYFLDRGVQEKI